MTIAHRLRSRARAALHQDDGVALIMVLGLGMVLTIVLVALSGYALDGYVRSKSQVDHSTAIAAAEAGVDDYVSRLNDNELYWTRGDSDPANAALTGWVGVPGSTNGGAYRYSVDASTTLSDGVVRLTVSGKVGKQVRTVVVKLARMAFTDYVYFSDFETGDPANPAFYPTGRGSYWNSHDPARTCGVYAWAGGWDTRDGSCTKIYWTQRDTVDGWFHTNDLFAVRDHPLFKGLLETGCPATRPGDPCYSHPLWMPDPGAGGSPQLEQPPAVGSRLSPMPASNAALRAEADPAQGGQGCLYTGPTRIVFNADGTMAVDSPGTPRTARCGTGARVPLPANGVIFVQNVPAGQGAVGSVPFVTTPSGVALSANSGGASFPLRRDVTPYSSRNGDAFVEGTLHGQVTLATDDDIVVTGDLTYAGTGGTDVLGLVAQNNVSLYHPVDSGGRELLADGQMKNVQVWGALLSVQHSINVQNFAAGTPRGDFTVHGSIIQRWRGAVGTFDGRTGTTSTGYRKDWHWDPRLRYAKPPRYLDPVSASWHAIDQAEAAPAFPG